LFVVEAPKSRQNVNNEKTKKNGETNFEAMKHQTQEKVTNSSLSFCNFYASETKKRSRTARRKKSFLFEIEIEILMRQQQACLPDDD
jgi:hypothetical protein